MPETQIGFGHLHLAIRPDRLYSLTTNFVREIGGAKPAALIVTEALLYTHLLYRFLVEHVAGVKRETQTVWGLCGDISRNGIVNDTISSYRMLNAWFVFQSAGGYTRLLMVAGHHGGLPGNYEAC